MKGIDLLTHISETVDGISKDQTDIKIEQESIKGDIEEIKSNHIFHLSQSLSRLWRVSVVFWVLFLSALIITGLFDYLARMCIDIMPHFLR